MENISNIKNHINSHFLYMKEKSQKNKSNKIIGFTSIALISILFIFKTLIFHSSVKKPYKKKQKTESKDFNKENDKNIETTNDIKETENINTKHQNKMHYKELEYYINDFLLLQENGLIKSTKALTFFIKKGFSISHIKKIYKLYNLHLDDNLNIKNFIIILYSKCICDSSNKYGKDVHHLY